MSINANSHVNSTTILLLFVSIIGAIAIYHDTRPEPSSAFGPPYYEAEYDNTDYKDADAFFEQYEEHSKALICDKFFHTNNEVFFETSNKVFKNSSLSWAWIDLLWDKCSYNYYE